MRTNLVDMELFEFACSGFWTFCGVAILVSLILYYLVNGIVRIVSRFFRMIMVSLRGWPPSHLDADGDKIKKKTV